MILFVATKCTVGANWCLNCMCCTYPTCADTGKLSSLPLVLHPPLICCPWHFVCTCLIQKEGIYIISEKLYYWEVKVKHLALRNTPPPIQTSLWDQQHPWMSFATEPFLLPEAQQIQQLLCAHEEFQPYTEHVSRIYRPYKRDEIHVFILRAYRVWLVGLYLKKNFCVQHSTTARYWYFIKPKYPLLKELHFRADYNNFPQIVWVTDKNLVDV